MRKVTWLAVATLALSGCSILYTDDRASGTATSTSGSAGSSGGSTAGTSSSSSGTSSSTSGSGSATIGATATSSGSGSGSGSSTGSGGSLTAIGCALAPQQPPDITVTANAADMASVARVEANRFGITFIGADGNQYVAIGKVASADGGWESPPRVMTTANACSGACIWPRISTGSNPGGPYVYAWSANQGSNIASFTVGGPGTLIGTIFSGDGWDVTAWGQAFVAAQTIASGTRREVFGSISAASPASAAAETFPSGTEIRLSTDVLGPGNPSYYAVLDPAADGGIAIAQIYSSGGFQAPGQPIPLPPGTDGSLGFTAVNGTLFATFLDPGDHLHVTGFAAPQAPFPNGGPVTQLGTNGDIGVSPSARLPLGVAGLVTGAGTEYLVGYTACPNGASGECTAYVAKFNGQAIYQSQARLDFSALNVHPQLAYDPTSNEVAVAWIDDRNSPVLRFFSCQ